MACKIMSKVPDINETFDVVEQRRCHHYPKMLSTLQSPSKWLLVSKKKTVIGSFRAQIDRSVPKNSIENMNNM